MTLLVHLPLNKHTHPLTLCTCRIVQMLWAWWFILIIIFHFVPISMVSHPIKHVWSSAVTMPLTALPYHAHLVLLWLAALAITFGSAFGFERLEVYVLDLCSVQGMCLVAVHHVPPSHSFLILCPQRPEAHVATKPHKCCPSQLTGGCLANSKDFGAKHATYQPIMYALPMHPVIYRHVGFRMVGWLRSGFSQRWIRW